MSTKTIGKRDKILLVMNCYLCSSTHFKPRKGQVRDNPELEILECQSCGLVTLNSLKHIRANHYEDSGMHGEEPGSMESWLNATLADDQRRFEMLRSSLPNKKVLDFGCGNGGFLLRANNLAAEVTGVELEKRVQEHWQGKLSIFPNIYSAGGGYDLITSFHVIEHLADPRTVLKELAGIMAVKGRIVVEVPNSEDVLLTLYDSDAFQSFTYWSQHLFLFNVETLKTLARQAGLKVVAVHEYQRYPLSNHLHWLSKGKPGGHQNWAFLDSPALHEAYSNVLAKINRSDTVIGYFEKYN